MTFSPRVLLLLTCSVISAAAQIPRTPEGSPDFQGIWTSATLTPLERPTELALRPTLTDQEAADYEAKARAAMNNDRRGRDVEQDLNCDRDHRNDCGMELARAGGGKRTSLIIDPPDGRVPPFKPESRLLAEERMRLPALFRSIKDRPLMERCLIGFGPSAGPPMIPGFYNNNYQIIQTPEYLMILAEMVHDVRIIRINSAHPSAAVRQWFGDSIARWETDSLVVETTNFRDETRFRGSSANMRVTERFTRDAKGGFLYRATVDDPATLTRPWTLEYPFLATTGPIYEYACHEGNGDVVRTILEGNPPRQ